MRGRRMRTDDRAPFLPILAAAAAVLTVLPVEAQEVWSGLDYYFRKLDGADPTLPANRHARPGLHGDGDLGEDQGAVPVVT